MTWQACKMIVTTFQQNKIKILMSFLIHATTIVMTSIMNESAELNCQLLVTLVFVMHSEFSDIPLHFYMREPLGKYVDAYRELIDQTLVGDFNESVLMSASASAVSRQIHLYQLLRIVFNYQFSYSFFTTQYATWLKRNLHARSESSVLTLVGVDCFAMFDV